MERNSQGIKYKYVDSLRVSAPAVVICIMLALVFGALPKLPSSVTRVLRPTFIAISLFAMKNSLYYRIGATKYHLINLLYYTFILFSFSITSTTISEYISILLYITFFLLAGNRVWTKKELRAILITVTLACTVQATITFFSNMGKLMYDGSSHIYFLGTVINRNTVAFAVVPGAVCSMILLLYDKKKNVPMKAILYLICCIVCIIIVFLVASRSAFFATLGGIICVMWQRARDSANKQERVERKALVVTMLIVGILSMMYVSQDTFSSRLFDFGEDANDSGRDVLWEEAWELIDEKPVFGGGFDYWEATGHDMGTHNAFLTFMVSTGWVGGILLALFFIMALIEMLKTRNFVPLAFMAEVLLHSWTEPGMDYFAYLPLTLAFMITRYLQHQNKNLSTIFI